MQRFRASLVSPALASRCVASLLLALVTVGSAGCAGSPVGSSLQQSLEADPRLEEEGGLLGQSNGADAEASPQADPVDALPEATSSLASPEPDTPPSGSTANRPTSGESEAATGGATRRPNAGTGTGSSSTASGGSLAAVPEDLKPYLEDLMALNFFSQATAPKPGTGGSVTFDPNRPITRGQYAQWLLTANNLFYSDQPSKKIRAATGSATPAFQDVPATHPYFEAIQGLAEAGLIPSALTGNSTAVNFRPDAPLTRESLVLWKVPLDSRTALPAASVDAVKSTWGFQDAAEIEPLALRAVLADHQIGDFANILRAFGYTTLFQPQKAVTQAEAAATLWRFGSQTEGISAEELLERPEESTQGRNN